MIINFGTLILIFEISILLIWADSQCSDSISTLCIYIVRYQVTPSLSFNISHKQGTNCSITTLKHWSLANKEIHNTSSMTEKTLTQSESSIPYKYKAK